MQMANRVYSYEYPSDLVLRSHFPDENYADSTHDEGYKRSVSTQCDPSRTRLPTQQVGFSQLRDVGMNVFRTRSLGLIANDTRLLHRQQNLLHHGCSRRVASESRTDRATRRQVATKTAASRSIKNSLATRDSIHAHKAGRARRMLSGSALPEDIMYLPMPKLSPSMVSP